MTPPENPPETAPAVVPNPHALSMQDAILALQRYWTDRGCLVVQPFNTEVGAGTGNPATALRVLGPEPWRVGYVEPSVRPDDARYGQNPNRLQTHTQFQVILKPDPGNPQELYLESLAVLGIDLDAHDVRFVEDNWASPALGAWGLGWEVWLDGMEITQFTYFQQAGGIVLKPISVEITYGLERILMALQGVQHVMDIRYAAGPGVMGERNASITYGEVYGQSEYEMSRYYLDDADVGTNRALFASYADEARRMVELELPVPAYTYVLKASHAFNVLDARGAISTTERASSFKIMRNLTRDAANLWVAKRESSGFPLGVVEPPSVASVPTELPSISEPATVLFEIGLEELPWSDVLGIGQVARDALAAKLGATRLPHGEVRLDGTPRRLIFTTADVAPAEPDTEEFKRGPKREAAFDAAGNPTKAAAGFCRGQGVEPSALETVEVNGVGYVGVTKAVTGRGAAQVLSTVLAEVVAELRSERNMRWADPNLTFSRPIRWLLALIGDQALPVSVSALSSGRTTRVLRGAAEPEVEVATADGYLDFLSGHGIVADRDARRTMIIEGARALAEQAGGVVDLDAQAELVEEITDLVEAPNPLLGSFEDRYMSLPAPVLTTVMRKHQRYLAVTDTDGNLQPRFVTVANGDCDVDLVRRGNEAVLRARYEDAAFFFGADQQVTPEEFHGRLDELNFETRLGSMADRASRIAQLATTLAAFVDGDENDRATLARAGELAKFDLATQVVVELSSLAGVMAGEYARQAGETEAVATALVEMELPHSSGGKLPTTVPGALLSLADRFDLLTGMIAIGNVPTGSSDPFGVRRAAIGVVNLLRNIPGLAGLSISDGVEAAARGLGSQLNELALPEDLVQQSVAVALRRYELQLQDAGNDHRRIQAVLIKADLPAEADRDLDELNRRIDDPVVAKLIEAVQRVIRILPDGQPPVSDVVALTGETEIALAEAITGLEGTLDDKPASLADFIAASQGLPERVDAFFDAVLVMDPDPGVREARLALLRRLAVVANRVLDWSAL